MKLILEQQIEGEVTKVEFTVDEDIDVQDLYRYLERFALAIGFMPESVENAIIDRCHEISRC